MAIQLGSMVQVDFDNDACLNDPARKLSGQTFVVKAKKTFRSRNSTYTRIYELYGAESKKGMPYSFLEENLKLVEGDN